MLPREFSLSFADLFGEGSISLTLHEGVTTFVGPNGSGKSQVLRQLKNKLGSELDGGTLLLSAGRLRPLEAKRVIERAHLNDPQQSGNLDLTIHEDYRDQWSNVETVKGVLNRISERVDVQIKIAERLRSLFGREIKLDWERGKLQVYFSREGEEYSGERESSGLLHLVGLLAALYDDSLDAVLIDEPDISLHPQLQSFLLREMNGVAGKPEEGKKMIVIATHSPAMVQIEEPGDLPRFVFFNDADTPPEQVDTDAGILNSEKLLGLIQNLGTSHREALFSQRPLLVEGPSDETIVRALDEALETYLHAAGGHVLPVGGTGGIAAAAKLLRLAGKDPAVLADLDSFTDGLNLANTFNQVEEGIVAANVAGHDNLHEAAKKAHDSLSGAVQNHWSAAPEKVKEHPYWKDAKGGNTIEIDRKRRALAATLLTESKEDAKKWSKGDKVWMPLRRKLQNALELMEQAGCFIVRRGEIEDCYADLGSRQEKIQEADREAEKIREDLDSAETRHAVVIRAIEHVAKSPEIDEAAAIRKAFLAVTPPALDKLREANDPRTEELEAAASQHAEETAQLFSMERTNEGDSPAIRVDLSATVLDVRGFPITLQVGDNVNVVADRRIKPS
jgi:hypothetical protein